MQVVEVPSTGAITAQKNLFCSVVHKFLIVVGVTIYQNDGKSVLFAEILTEITYIGFLLLQSWTKPENSKLVFRGYSRPVTEKVTKTTKDPWNLIFWGFWPQPLPPTIFLGDLNQFSMTQTVIVSLGGFSPIFWGYSHPVTEKSLTYKLHKLPKNPEILCFWCSSPTSYPQNLFWVILTNFQCLKCHC